MCYTLKIEDQSHVKCSYHRKIKLKNNKVSVAATQTFCMSSIAEEEGLSKTCYIGKETARITMRTEAQV